MLKIGYMEYANVHPIFYRLLNDNNFSFKRGFPADLNKAMRLGDIDISPSSSIEFARNPSLYNIIPNVSISSIGHVKSVCLFGDYLPSELNGQRVSFTKESNTSTVLCRIILEKFYNVKPVYVDDESAFDAELLIGDKALHRYYDGESKHIIDLGLEWNKFTNLPFVFALWIVNKNITAKDGLLSFIDSLHKYSSKKGGFDPKVFDKYVQKGYTEEQLVDYWNIIDYELGAKHIEGLTLFYKYAYELGETKEDASLLLDEAFIKF